MAWGDEKKDEKWRTEVGSARSKAKRNADWGQAVKSPTDKHWSNVRDHLGKLLNAPFEFFRREEKPLQRLLDDPDKFFAREQRASDKFFGGHAKQLDRLLEGPDSLFRRDAEHLAKLLGGGRYTLEVRKRFSGNPEIAARFMGPARLLLGQLMEDMAYNSLQQGVRRAVIPVNQGTVAIVATSSHGQSEVWIDARGITPGVAAGALTPYLFAGVKASGGPRLYITEPPDAAPPQALGSGTIEVISGSGRIQTYGNGVNTAITVGIDNSAFIDITYFMTAHGMYGVPDWINEESELGLYPPSVLAKHLEQAGRTDVNYPNFFNSYVLDPAAEDLPFPPVALPGWYQVRLDWSPFPGTQTASIIIELGAAASRHTFPPFEVTLEQSQRWGGALFIDVVNGVVARLETAQINGVYDLRFQVLPTPDLTGATLFYHPDSPLLP
jgi:hypothetical protein